jgi:signal transduction histidine kinase
MVESGIRCARHWLVRLCLLFWAGLASAMAAGKTGADIPLDISRAQRLDLSRHLQVCVSSTEARLEQILEGACEWDSKRPPSVSRGFDRRAFWIRLDLVNRSTARADRLLSVGHARLQEVSLFRVPETGRPVVLGRSGSRVALSAKPVPLPKPSFRLGFEPGERKTLWLRVASETIIEFAPELQSLETGYFNTQRLQLFQALAIGCMLLCFVYSVGAYLILRESTLLFFGIFMVAEILVELTRSGLLQTYLWPASLPFNPRMLSLGVVVSIGAFSIFLRGFIPDLTEHRITHHVFRSALIVFYGGMLWSLFIDYRSGSVLWSYALIVWMLSILVLAIQSWRNGSPTAKLLFQSFMLLMAIELLRFWSVTGWIDFSDIEALGNPVAIALTSSLILIGMIRRLREMQSDLSRTREESAARLSFMSQMSHELRSPLTTILGQLRLMARSEIPERARKMVEAMRQDAGQLLSMIDDILDYAQGTAGKQSLHCSVRRWDHLAERIEQRARILAQVNGNRLVFHSDGPGHAPFLVDERRLLQVLSNLLANAANYCRDGVIELSCRIAQGMESDDWNLSFTVSDTGPGIAQEDQQRIFQPFERGAEAHLSHHKGVGMGLAISRQLVELLGGQLELWSEPGKGSRFSFCIPCQAAQSEEVEWGEDEGKLIPARSATGSDERQIVSAPAPAPVAACQLLGPGKDQLDQLLSLVDNGQISDILEMMDMLEKMEPELGPFCGTARDLALQLDLQALRMLCAGQRQD